MTPPIIIATFAAFIAFIASIVGIAYFIFAPFKNVVQRKTIDTTRFRLTDLFAFVFTFQLGFGGINLAAPDANWTPQIAIVMAFIVLSTSGLAWFYGLRILWKMNAAGPLKRIMLLGVVMPFGFVTPIVFVPLLLFIDTPMQGVVRLFVLGLFVLFLRQLGAWILSEENHLQPQRTESVD